MGIGENLRRQRQNNGLTQVQLSEMIGVKQCTIAQYERGTKAISLALAFEITKILKCSLYDLVGEEEQQCKTA